MAQSLALPQVEENTSGEVSSCNSIDAAWTLPPSVERA
eukprot:CAMPEP_0184966338 /NCGR_PEP_ID=MMETSP1098-20130426/29_1 /TAXON_ID=89044 /ORGANISM="Spumella elongata, Strain CCAP 955/1" /LENGTH=37 /DNA_ID= /DNA_START= /DNA_END= /DNA_ORIENTATION=